MAVRHCEIKEDINKIEQLLKTSETIKDKLYNLKEYYSISVKMLDHDIDIINNVLLKYSDYKKLILKIKNDLEIEKEKDIEYLFLDENISTLSTFENDINEVFKIEEKYLLLASEVWKKDITYAEEFENGKDFMIVFESLYSSDINKASREQNPLIEANLISNDQISISKDKVGFIHNVDKNNFVAATKTDSMLVKSNEKNEVTLKSENGFNYNVLLKEDFEILTKLCLPIEINQRCKNASIFSNGEILNIDVSKTLNKVYLDAKNSDPKAVLLISDGCDLLFKEYLVALKLSRDYNVPIKVLNKGLYRKNANLPSYTLKEEKVFQEKLSYFVKNKAIESESLIKPLNDYLKIVVEPCLYSEEINAALKTAIARKIENIKEKYTGLKK